MITIEDAQRMRRAGYALEIFDGKIGNFIKDQKECEDADVRANQG